MSLGDFWKGIKWVTMDTSPEKRNFLCTELMLKAEQAKGRETAWEVVSSLFLEVYKTRVWQS